MKAKNISGHRVKVEYGFLKTRKRELLDPGQTIEIDDFDRLHLERLGVFKNRELEIVAESITEDDRMLKAKREVEQYINQNNKK